MPAPRRLTVMVSLDVTGFTRLVQQDERATLAGIAAIRRDLIDATLQHRNGHIFKTMGDGALIEFPNVEDAVSWTVEFQEAMSARNLRYPEKPILVRAGIALGDVYVEGEDRFGAAIAAVVRLQEVAPPGGIAMTHSVRWQLGKALRARFTRVIETLKGFDEPWEIWVWTTSGDCGAFAAGSSRRIDRNEKQLSIVPDKPSIAVLPFQNMSGDPEQEYFADGMVEDIISGLSYLPWLMVIARNSTFTYKGKVVDVKQVGRELGVRYVLEGRVRKAGARVRISGQLIDATTGGHIWAGRFDGALEDVFDLQDRVTASVVGAIEPRLQRAEIERARRKPTESLDAYDYFLRGMASFFFTKDSLLEARRHFERATELDPNYASPYGMAVWCVHLRKTNGWMLDPERELAEGVRLARRAVAVGKDDPTALWSGGHGLAYLAGEVEAGFAYIDRAIALNPNLAAAWSSSGWLCIYLGEPANAIERLERSMRLSPLDPFAYFGYAGMALAHLLADRFDEAVSWAAKARNEQPDWATALRVAAIAYALSDRLVEAREAVARLCEIDPTLRLANLERVAPPLRRPEDRARFIGGLRKAGLPE